MIWILIIAFVTLVAVAWAAGIDMMKQQHPDYKGEDFLDWDEKDHNDIF